MFWVKRIDTIIDYKYSNIILESQSLYANQIQVFFYWVICYSDQRLVYERASLSLEKRQSLVIWNDVTDKRLSIAINANILSILRLSDAIDANISENITENILKTISYVKYEPIIRKLVAIISQVLTAICQLHSHHRSQDHLAFASAA